MTPDSRCWQHRARLGTSIVTAVWLLMAACFLVAIPASADHEFGCDPMLDPSCGGADPAYDEPAAYDDSTFDGGAFDPTCDPTVNPEWASDPFCNPVSTPNVLGFDGRAIADPGLGLSTRADLSDDRPLEQLDPESALVVSAGRMLLAVDALAELGAFWRFDEPELAVFMRDLRDRIPADGLDESGYVAELERFVDDVGPYLESLEASGVDVGEALWLSLESLEFGGLDDVRNGRTAFIDPFQWLEGLTTLLLNGGATDPLLEGVVDTGAIEEFALRYAVAVDDTRAASVPTPSTIVSEPTEPPVMPPATTTDVGSAEPDASAGFPAGAAAGGVGVALAAGGGVVWSARRRRRSLGRRALGSPEIERPIDPAGTTSTAAPSETDTPPEAAAPAGAPAATPPPAEEEVGDDRDLSLNDLLDASRRMTAALDTASIAAIALAEATRLVGAEGGLVVRRSGGGFDVVACDPRELFNPDRAGEGALSRVLDTGQANVSIATDDPALTEVPSAIAAVPIVAGGIVSGAILVIRVAARPFGRKELDALEMLAPLVGSAFSAADTHETATDLVDIEPLTGLQNRRRLDRDLAALSADEQVAYVMVDVDHFKNFNDSNGHAAGDEALRQVSAILKASVRPGDLVYRYGGEEFCVLLPGATATDAARVAERARAAVEAAPIPGRQHQPNGRVTISVGVSESAWASPSELVERADAALYEAKRTGRNQVVLDDPFSNSPNS